MCVCVFVCVCVCLVSLRTHLQVVLQYMLPTQYLMDQHRPFSSLTGLTGSICRDFSPMPVCASTWVSEQCFLSGLCQINLHLLPGRFYWHTSNETAQALYEGLQTEYLQVVTEYYCVTRQEETRDLCLSLQSFDFELWAEMDLQAMFPVKKNVRGGFLS